MKSNNIRACVFIVISTVTCKKVEDAVLKFLLPPMESKQAKNTTTEFLFVHFKSENLRNQLACDLIIK